MKFVKNFFVATFILAFCIAVYIIVSGYIMYKEAIEITPLDEKVTIIRQKEYYTNINEIPQIYINALISVEDHRFYEHGGIDVVSICRALVNDLKAMDFVEGGSTITQQLAKNMYFTQEKILSRKIAELFMAFKIEENYDKDEILELYINTSYYGDGYYTLKEATYGYFNKIPSDMTDYECILLAGIPNAPSIYAPTKNPDLAKQRQLQVISKMIKYGYLTKEETLRIIDFE